VSAAEVEIARGQWAEAYRRLQETRADRRRHERLMRQVDAVSAELRRRVGETFTLAELAGEYRRAEPWVRDAVDAVAAAPADLNDVPLVEDAAFHLYARAAVDYEP
jgi:hypothetical protein